MTLAAAPSAATEREERIFAAAFGIMDSGQEGEAVAAFIRVRGILHHHGGSFRRLLERCEEAERLSEEMGRQNAALRRENAALRARDKRQMAEAGAPWLSRFQAAATSFQHWDVGVVIVIAVWAAFGLLGPTSALAAGAVVLICAAFVNWFSPLRLFAGAVLALAAYATTVAPAPAKPSGPSASATAIAQAAGSAAGNPRW